MARRTYALLIALPLALDCAGNMLLGGSWRNTLSGEAWEQRDHKYWGWTHRFINALFFDPKHCENAAVAERAYGSIWGWWRTLFKD